MLNRIVAAGFQNVVEADQVAFDMAADGMEKAMLGWKPRMEL